MKTKVTSHFLLDLHSIKAESDLPNGGLASVTITAPVTLPNDRSLRTLRTTGCSPGTMLRTAALFILGTITFSLSAQQWFPVTGAPSGLAVCQTMSADTCQIARSMSDHFVTSDGGASFDSTQTMFTTEWCLDMHFPTAQVGYACGGSHFGVFTNVITKTVDGGASWFPVTNDEFPGYSFGSIHFVTQEIGFVSGDVGTFLKTVDGGATFTPLEVQLPELNSIVDIHFNGTNGYVCTRTRPLNTQDDDDIYRILKTTDLGDTWNILYADTVLDRTYTTDRGVNSVRFLGAFGLACGNNGLLLRTTDGGSTWSESILLSDTTFLRDMEMVNEQTAYIMTIRAYAGELRNTLRTDDGGLTWTTMPEKFLNISVKDGTGYAIDDEYHLFKNMDVLNRVPQHDAPVLALFPNPTTGQVTMLLSGILAIGHCSVFDGNGRVVLEQGLAAQRSLTLHTAGLAAGTYVVQVKDLGSDRIYRQRLVVQ